MSLIISPAFTSLPNKTIDTPWGKIIWDPLTNLPYSIFNYTSFRSDYTLDPRLKERMIKLFYSKLIDDWLYNDKSFEKLCKYFVTEKKDEGMHVSFVSSLNNLTKKPTEEQMKYIFRFIEKVLINEKIIASYLEEYVDKAHVQWYDLPQNNKFIKKLFRHKLRVVIEKVIKKNEK